MLIRVRLGLYRRHAAYVCPIGFIKAGPEEFIKIDQNIYRTFSNCPCTIKHNVIVDLCVVSYSYSFSIAKYMPIESYQSLFHEAKE